MDAHQPGASESLLVNREIGTKHTTTPHASTEAHETDSTKSYFRKQGQSVATSPVLKAWFLDFVSCAISTASFAAIIAILASQNGNPLPSWPFGITVNALISVFSVLFKVTLLVPVAGALSQLKWSWFEQNRPLADLVDFDNASRGNVWSSALLIVKTKGVQIPALGGLLMITAIAVDPFIQQVVRYDPCSRPLPDILATVARTNNYTAWGIRLGATDETLDAPMQNAIYKGIYNAWDHVSPVCKTGNCTFSAFRSTAICGQCENVANELWYTPTDARTRGPLWSLPSGPQIGSISPIALNMSSRASPPEKLTDMMRTEIIAVTNYTAYRDFHSPMLPLIDYHPTPVEPTSWAANGTNFITAARCSLQPCIRTTTVQLLSNDLIETTMSSEEMAQQPWDIDNPVYSWTGTPMPCLINGTSFSASSFTQSNTTNKWPVQGLLPNNQTAFLPDECIFNYASAMGLSIYLQKFLNGTLSIATGEHTAIPAYVEQLWSEDFSEESKTGTYNAGSSFDLINQTWSNLADAMSAHIRQTGDALNSAPAVGQILQMETCINVRWPWLSYPIALLALTIVLVTASALGSFRRGSMTRDRLWRDSPLALLFNSLDDESRSLAKCARQKGEMENLADRLHARLVVDDDGAEWRCAEVR